MQTATRERRDELAVHLREAANRIFAKRCVDEIARDLVPVEARFKAELMAAFEEEGALVARVAEPLLDDPRYMIAEAKWRTSLGPAQIDNLINTILSSARLRDWASERLTPKFWEHYDNAQNTVGRALIRAGLVTNLTQTAINQILDQGGRRLGLLDIIGDARLALFRAIQQGMDGGLNPRQTARLIRDFIPEGRFVNAGSNYRAQLIARTETLHAQRKSSLDRYRTNRNVRMVMAFDGQEDPDCAERDGQMFTLDDAEVEMWAEHPNGTLAFGPVAL